jgi:2-hydroxychromene-2-carboxylate isomerase
MRVRFLFDFLSPYAYLAWTQAPRVARHHGAAIDPLPVLLSAMSAAHGEARPAELTTLPEHTTRDVLRRASALGVAVSPPASFPFNPLLALRAASLDLDPGDRHRLIDAVFQAAWVDGRPIDDPDELAWIANAIGLDGLGLVREASGAAAKTRLRAQTDKAISRGVSSVPAALAAHPDGPDEVFFGPDAIANLDAFLRGDPHVAPAALRRWATVPPGSGKG